MAHEVTPWKEPNCALSLAVDTITDRETYSREINEKYGGGGGLNAGYRTVEAVAIVVSLLASEGIKYGSHFVFKTGGGELIHLDFYDAATKLKAQEILANHLIEFSNI